MTQYPTQVREHFFHPQNVGDVVDATAIGRGGSPICGAAMRVSLRIDSTQRIIEARFKAAACGFLIASASELTERIIGQTTAAAAAIAQNPETAVLESLGSLPASRQHCAALACQTVVGAIQAYSDAVRDQWSGDEALICSCFCVSESTIEAEIQRRKLQTVAEVTAACRAGAGCRSCHSLIRDLLDDHQRNKWQIVNEASR